LSALRKNGFVPAVVYGYQIEPVPVAVNEREFKRLLSREGKNGIITLNIEGKEVKAVVSQLQRDTTKEKYIHVDFLSIDMSKLIGIEVPIILKGLPIGIKEGGVLHQPLRFLKLIVKPNEIPEKVEIDVSNLAIGDTLTIGDIRGKVKYTISGDDQLTLVIVSTPTIRMDLDTEITDQTGEAV
jgi:large subunit ribosomal protein L25